MKRNNAFYIVLTIILTGVIIMSGLSAGCALNKAETPAPETKAPENKAEDPVATIVVKDYGTIVLELYPDVAPITVSNFITLANSGYYDGLIFHRVIRGFMIQGGDKTGTGYGLTEYTIKGEFAANGVENNIKHLPGVISMARANGNDTACSQFFICSGTADWLDGKYAAFGRTLEGLEVVMAIEKVETNGANDRPFTNVVMESVRVDTKGVDYSQYEKISR